MTRLNRTELTDDIYNVSVYSNAISRSIDKVWRYRVCLCLTKYPRRHDSVGSLMIIWSLPPVIQQADTRPGGRCSPRHWRSYTNMYSVLRFLMPQTMLCVCYWSSRSPASTICQASSTVCSKCSPQHVWKSCFFCHRTNSLEFTAMWFVGCSCWLAGHFSSGLKNIFSLDITGR